MIPEKAQAKVQQATVVAVGPGSTNKDGKVTPVCVKVGDKVLLPEYGGTKIVLEEKDYFLFRDGCLIIAVKDALVATVCFNIMGLFSLQRFCG